MSADIYAFGCVAYEVLTGNVLFDGPSATAVVSAHITHDGRPPPLVKMAEATGLGHAAALISHCLRKNPQDRPDVATLRGALRNLGGRVAHLAWPLA
jgi:serine/threonine protein kinase